MKTQSIKLGLCAALLSLLMVGCSSTSTTDGGTETLPGDSVSTGMVGGSGVSGSGGAADDLARIADTVFYFDFDKAILKPEFDARKGARDLSGDERLTPHWRLVIE